MIRLAKLAAVLLFMAILLLAVRPVYFLVKSNLLARDARVSLQNRMAPEDDQVEFLSVSSFVYSDLFGRLIFLTERSPRETIQISAPEGCSFFSQGYEIIRSPENLGAIEPTFGSPDFERMTAFIEIKSASILNSCVAKGLLGSCSSTVGGAFSYSCR